MTEASQLSPRSGLLGLIGALAGAGVGGSLAGVLEAWWASRAGASDWLMDAAIGLCAPLALGLGFAVFAVRGMFLGGEAWSPRAFVRWLSGLQGHERAIWQVMPPLCALSLVLALLAVAGTGARILGAEASGLSGGALLVFAALVVLTSLAAATQLVGSGLAARLGAREVSPALTVGASVFAFSVALSILIALGETGGGGGPLAILGVLRRQELDLRAPGLLLLMAGGAFLLPSPQRSVAILVGVLAVAIPLMLTLHAYRGGSLTALRGLSIERHAPLSRVALGLLRKLSDRDRDGASAAFAGGDCDDRDPSVNPGAEDVPDNGKDEDCADGDARAPTQAPRKADSAAQANSAGHKIADDLNVVLITIDTLRADLGYMGNPRPLSPNLDALAAKSVVYERAYSLASYTGKSLGPLLIGKYSSELDGGFLHFNRYPKHETFLQERLQAAGVRTLSVQGYWYFFQNAGFERGFDVLDSSAAPKVAAIEGDQTSNSDKLSDAAIKLLEGPELAKSRFFMWLHYVDPHAEYALHPEHDFGKKPRERYEGEVAFVDRHVGRLLEALAGTSFGERTAIIVTSDHGEAFGEHGMIRHGFELWEELVRVPLILRIPGVEARRLSVRRSGIDLVPTVLELFKIAHQPRGAGDFLSGESLLPDIAGGPGSSPAERAVFIDMARGPHNTERQALIENDLKLTVSEGRVLGLYDLAGDPLEKLDLSGDMQRLAPARQNLTSFRSRLRRVPMPTR